MTADVCVVGGGLAGLCAALTAAEEGASVALAVDGPVPGGSSFYGGTWGLGMVLPAEETAQAADALAAAVLKAGLGCSNDGAVRAVCDDAWDTVHWLESLGLAFRAPSPGHEKDVAYVPCFDDEVRGWRGFEPARATAPLARRLDEAGVVRVAGHAVSLFGTGDRVSGVLTVGDKGCDAVIVSAGATVLATGGTAGLCATCLTLPSLQGNGVALALDAGAETRGLEFLQIMAGMERHGRPFVCNEKVWRATRLTDGAGRDAFEAAGISPETERQALFAHSNHGPFTTERMSRYVEQAIAQAVVSGGCWATTDLEQLRGQEFVEDFAAWLRDKGIDPERPEPVRLYAQAANGGIVVDAKGATRVRGLYAAGECAQVFGADRLGGLASVMAMTLGRAAGQAAAHEPTPGIQELRPLSPLGTAVPENRHAGLALKRACDDALLGPRTTERLSELAERARSLREELESSPIEGDDPKVDWNAVLANARLRQQAKATEAVAEACLARTQSLGPHWRLG